MGEGEFNLIDKHKKMGYHPIFDKRYFYENLISFFETLLVLFLMFSIIMILLRLLIINDYFASWSITYYFIDIYSHRVLFTVPEKYHNDTNSILIVGSIYTILYLAVRPNIELAKARIHPKQKSTE